MQKRHTGYDLYADGADLRPCGYFFIGQTHNDLQVAAVSLCTPVFLLFMSVGTVFGLGGTSVISRAMGEGRTDYARKVSAFCMWSCVGIGVAMSLAFWLFLDRILILMGASAEVWEYAKNYLRIVTACGPFVLISNCYSNVLRAEGQATVSMIGMLVGNLLNVILDPILILLLGWEIAGATIATVIGNIAAALYYLLYFRKGTSMLSIHPRDFTVGEGICKNVLVIGIPASLASLLMSISQIIMNSCMTQYGDMAVAGVGVAMKVTRLRHIKTASARETILFITNFLSDSLDIDKRILRQVKQNRRFGRTGGMPDCAPGQPHAYREQPQHRFPWHKGSGYGNGIRWEDSAGWADRLQYRCFPSAAPAWDRHIARLKKGECTVEAGFIWSDILTNLERTSDHCSNIAVSIIDAGVHTMNAHESVRTMKENTHCFNEKYEAFAKKYALGDALS